MILSREERLKLFYRRLSKAPRVDTSEKALLLLSSILDGVEDAFSGVPNAPELWQSDGRMYPPEEDNARPVTDYPGVTQYRSRNHRTVIATNGAIQIVKINSGEVEFSKPGKDGKNVWGR